MSLSMYRGQVWAIQELFKQAAEEIAQGGEIKPAKKLDQPKARVLQLKRAHDHRGVP